MEIIRSIEELRKKLNLLVQDHKQVGFVPTMGFFHEGHLSLIEHARKENDIVVTSIFVNPLQFGPNEDFERYPRDEKRDGLLAEKAGVDFLFIPDVSEMYPGKLLINMSIEGRTNVLCGRTRPGHFDGVITVLTKLFHIVHPHKAYFGLKDAQQIAVVDALIKDLNFAVDLIGIPTIREQDGLAKSSRNVFLDTDEYEQATWLYKALKKGQQFVIDGETNPDIIIKEVINTINQKTTAKIDYVELLGFPSLEPISTINQQVILATAVFFKKARLIDNLLFDKNGQTISNF